MPKRGKKKIKNKKKAHKGKKSNMVMTSNSLTNGGQLFPPIFRTSTLTHVSYNNAAASAYYTLSFKANSYNLMGPQVNNSGAYGSNVPSGLIYLLSSSSNAGANAPYTAYRIKSSKITLRHVSNSSSTNVPIYITIVPSAKSDLSGLSLTQWQEQPYSKTILVPSQVTYPYTVNRAMSTQRLLGQEYKSNMEDNEYFGTAVADPTFVWYWHIRVTSANATTVIDSYMDVKISHASDFIIHNQYSSTTPS